jgi:hypothetical protein
VDIREGGIFPSPAVVEQADCQFIWENRNVPGGVQSMPQTFDIGAFDRATDPLLQFLSREQAEALIAYRGRPELLARIDELASKNTEGELTDGERAEYEGYVKANSFVAVLQAKARRFLAVGEANGPSNA